MFCQGLSRLGIVQQIREHGEDCGGELDEARLLFPETLLQMRQIHETVLLVELLAKLLLALVSLLIVEAVGEQFGYQNPEEESLVQPLLLNLRVDLLEKERFLDQVVSASFVQREVDQETQNRIQEEQIVGLVFILSVEFPYDHRSHFHQFIDYFVLNHEVNEDLVLFNQLLQKAHHVVVLSAHRSVLLFERFGSQIL